MGYRPRAKYHLYETAHSGFYGGELSAETVNLMPRTWTKYTVTDGVWKTENTFEPLWNRDIYLANEIDKVAEDKRGHYVAGSHFVIDHESRTMYVSPFEHRYTFTAGLFYDSDDYSVTTEIPYKIGGVKNGLYLSESGIDYNAVAPSPQYTAWCDTTHSATPSLDFETKLNGGKMKPYFDLDYGHPTMVVMVSKAVMDYDDYVCSGEWRSSKLDCFLPYEGKKYEGERFVGATATYDDEGTSAWENASAYVKNETSSVSGCFDLFDRQVTKFGDGVLSAGRNFISGEYVGTNMCPKYRTLYVW